VRDEGSSPGEGDRKVLVEERLVTRLWMPDTRFPMGSTCQGKGFAPPSTPLRAGITAVSSFLGLKMSLEKRLYEVSFCTDEATLPQAIWFFGSTTLSAPCYPPVSVTDSFGERRIIG